MCAKPVLHHNDIRLAIGHSQIGGMCVWVGDYTVFAIEAVNYKGIILTKTKTKRYQRKEEWNRNRILYVMFVMYLIQNGTSVSWFVVYFNIYEAVRMLLSATVPLSTHRAAVRNRSFNSIYLYAWCVLALRFCRLFGFLTRQRNGVDDSLSVCERCFASSWRNTNTFEEIGCDRRNGKRPLLFIHHISPCTKTPFTKYTWFAQ